MIKIIRYRYINIYKYLFNVYFDFKNNFIFLFLNEYENFFFYIVYFEIYIDKIINFFIIFYQYMKNLIFYYKLENLMMKCYI